MGWFRTEAGWRGGAALLLALALAVRLAAPTGWMLAPGDGHGLPQLVICTGHGPLDLGVGQGQPGHPAPDKSSDHPCVFAGAAAPTAPAPLAILQPSTVAVAIDRIPAAIADQRPGRGLAAPPPPSRAPPASI